MGKKELSTWIRSGVVEKNLKETFDSTLDALGHACPLKKSRESIYKSLQDLLYNDKNFRQSSLANITMFGWLADKKLSSSSSSSSQKQSKPFAVFKKTRFHSSAVGQHATVTNNRTNNTTTRDSSSIEQSFSFTEKEQGVIIEPFINLAERTVYDFLVNNEDIIPLEIVESFADKQRPPISKDFSNADLLCMLNFILENIAIFSKKSVFHGQYKTNPAELLINFKKNVRNKLAHGIVVSGKGRWSDHALQHVSIFACEVIICLGGNYEEVFANKEDIDSEIIKRWIDKASQKRKSEVILDNEENVNPSQKRKFDNVFDDKENIDVSQKRRLDLGKITEFVLDILEDLEGTEKDDGKKILKLVMDENEYVMKLWKTIKAEERKIQLMAIHFIYRI
ncbi:16554_t:CDS:2 [Acaulospora colombiana]|uniref:16554_t:CDS:1 n=1 Tax=Acaulospora colombiana TaxID=27376 RepID=A0ACA9L8D8_9GLOM|nr:16554_t:CDS:2 [Acaulospora colombiana]